MELRYENLKSKPKAFRSFTGFDMKEFQILLGIFTTAWEGYSQQNRLPAELRQRGYGGDRKAGSGAAVRLGAEGNHILLRHKARHRVSRGRRQADLAGGGR